MTNEQREAAYWQGVAAFILGFPRIPVYDPDLMTSIEADPTNISDRLGAWLNGWDHANLDRIDLGHGMTASAQDVALVILGVILEDAING